MADPITRTAARIAVLVAVPLAILAGVGTFALLGGFSGDGGGPDAAATPSAPAATGPVPTEERPLTERQETVCRALMANLPDEVGGLRQRPVTAGAEQNAAYGDPAMTVACGVEEVTYELTDHVWPVSGVCWYADERADATVLTTLDREVPVQVTVPAAYEAPLQRVAGLAGPITDSIRPTDDAPTGCREP